MYRHMDPNYTPQSIETRVLSVCFYWVHDAYLTQDDFAGLRGGTLFSSVDRGYGDASHDKT